MCLHGLGNASEGFSTPSIIHALDVAPGRLPVGCGPAATIRSAVDSWCLGQSVEQNVATCKSKAHSTTLRSCR
jgi:hypothetical protein